MIKGWRVGPRVKGWVDMEVRQDCVEPGRPR